MKNSNQFTQWVDFVTPLNAENLNKINYIVQQMGVDIDDVSEVLGLTIEEVEKLRSMIGNSSATIVEDIPVVGIEVGGFKPGDVIKSNTSLTEFVKQLVTKEINPTYVSPTISLKTSISGIVENGLTISPILTPSFVKNDAGEPTKYVLKRNNIEIFSGANPVTYTDNVTVSHNQNISYSCTVTYADGEIKTTNLGNPYPTGQITAGSKTATSNAITPFAPTYYGVSDEIPTTEQDLLNLLKIVKNNKSYTFNNIIANNQHIVYAYPKSFGTLSNIKDGNGFSYVNSYTRKEITCNSVEYYVYVLTSKTTVNGFSQIYS